MFNSRRYVEMETVARELVNHHPQSGIVFKALGLSLWMQGKDALSALERATQLLPADAEVHSNLGNALRALGRLDDAAASYRRALAINPDYAEAHNNLGNLLRDLGQFDAAVTSCGRALKIKPDFAAAHCNLGAAQRGLGQLEDAVASYRRAIAYKPDFAEAYSNLGNALRNLGQLGDAAASYRSAIAYRPDLAEAHSSLGNILLDLGQLDDAEASFRRGLELKPDSAEAYCDLGNALRALGKRDEAAASYHRALELNSGYAQAHNNLGNALRDLGRLDEAAVSYREALRLEPDMAEAHNNLGNALRDLGRLDEAAASYREALRLKPDLAGVHNNLAIVLGQQGRIAEAESVCRGALEMFPNSAATIALLAKLHADKGQFAEAEALFKRAIFLEPESAEAWAGIAGLRKFTDCDATWLAEAQRIAEQGAPPRQEAQLRFAIGKYFDDVGDFPQAFINYQRANELAKPYTANFDKKRLTRAVDLIIHSCDQSLVTPNRTAVSTSRRPIFIVGMPRSGTSLAEQILASHPDVFGAGELPFWTVASSSFDSSLLNGETGATLLCKLAEEYLQLLQDLAPQADRVVDKMPANFWNLGLIHAVFPSARIIHMRRNPLDTCLSIYFQDFWAAHSYANDLEELAYYYTEYRRLMEHWRSALPLHAMLDVPYEELIDDPEAWTRKMLEFIDVPWDPICVDFHQVSRTVTTASKWQVRQKIYRSSVGRWRNYERFLGPLLTLTRPPATSGAENDPFHA
jgi:tetratricopeptide (TPR) repeat protein